MPVRVWAGSVCSVDILIMQLILKALVLLDFSLTVNFNIHICVWLGYFIC